MATKEVIYSVYDIDDGEVCVFCGSSKECSKFLNMGENAIIKGVSKTNNNYIPHSYSNYVVKKTKYELDYQECEICGRILPIENFPLTKNMSGNPMRRNVCNDCYRKKRMIK